MTSAINKARQYGCGFATVRNSNHYGIAGFYAMMALEHDMIGISATNAAVLVVPTFGRDAVYGTNPIALAVPAEQERPLVVDMATSTVPRGKLEVYNRQEKPLPLGWATDEHGVPTADAARVLDNFPRELQPPDNRRHTRDRDAALAGESGQDLHHRLPVIVLVLALVDRQYDMLAAAWLRKRAEANEV